MAVGTDVKPVLPELGWMLYTLLQTRKEDVLIHPYFVEEEAESLLVE